MPAQSASLKPNFLIIGAAKCGTTSLYQYLRSHPDVFMPERKEPTFFAVPEAGGITDEAEYLALFSGADGKKAIGEASISYLYDPGSPVRIRSYLGDQIKIIVLVRNPVDMSYSLWGHQVRMGAESLSFESGLARETDRLNKPEFAASCLGWVANYAYTGRAMYGRQIQRYFNTFGPANIKVFIYEEFFRPGFPLYGGLCNFLGISEEHIPNGKVYNPAGTIRSKWLRRIYNERLWWKEPLKLLLPLPIRRKLMEAIFLFNQKQKLMPALSLTMRGYLEGIFSPDVRLLENLIDRDLSQIWF